ncbi:apyrase [Ranunculus cassubicifolius]
MRRSNAPKSPPPSKNMDSSIKHQFRPINTRPIFPRKPSTKFNPIIILTLLITFLIFLISRNFRNSPKTLHYKIVIDGGSTGTRIHVFRVLDGSKSSFDFGKDGLMSMRVTPGLGSFIGDPVGAGGSLIELLRFGKEIVPRDYWGETEVRLMGTAGLRRVEDGVREKILESCRKVLRESGFKFRDDWVSVITGSDEGIFAWVAANYALGTLGSDPQKTVGIVELGGASAQVTFVSSETLPPEYAHSLKYGEITYNLYSHSLLHLGQNVAYDSLRELLLSKDPKYAESHGDGLFHDPCSPRGYTHSTSSWNHSPGPIVHASGNFSECRTAALKLLQEGKEQCRYKHCYIGNTYIPELRGRLLATENFFHTSKFFGLPSKAILSDLMLAGEQFCGEDWLKLQKKYPSLDQQDLLRYCFSSAYIVALLHDSLGIALDDGRIGFANQVGDIPLDWALGAFIMQNMADLEREDNYSADWISALLSACWVQGWRCGSYCALLDTESV